MDEFDCGCSMKMHPGLFATILMLAPWLVQNIKYWSMTGTVG
ncbi:MAG TPA: hypothetical protein VKM55_02700 [Candidatus Lokiarchaeia archaeon]|nr:hypothetical protein [Candidatus Lokiarchaeia archaeon]